VNHRCPHCGRDLASRKLAGAIIARMDLDCPQCHGALTVNVHPAETGLVLASVGGAGALAALAYAAQSQGLLLAALAVGIGGAGAVYVLERTRLRDWPRYAPRAAPKGME
jgi:hypothetical protein